MKFLILIILLIFNSCLKKEDTIISPQKTMSLSIGNSDTDLSFFQNNKDFKMQDFNIEMKDGLIFLSNPATNKILTFNSYGNLLASIYDPKKNPEPVLIKGEDNQNIQQAFPYNFNKIGKFITNSEKELIIIDKINEESITFSKNLQLLLTDKILVFTQTGELKFQLGQEGINGNPFPSIEFINCDEKNCINIIAKSGSHIFYFKYDRDGTVLYNKKIDKKDILEKESPLSKEIIKIVNANNQNSLFFIIDKFEIKKRSKKPEFTKTKIVKYDLNKNIAKDFISLPETETSIQNNKSLATTMFQTVFEYIGKNSADNLFFIAPEDENIYKVLIVKDKKIIKKRIGFNFDNPKFFKLSVSPEGIIIGAVLFYNRVDIFWWRTDD